MTFQLDDYLTHRITKPEEELSIGSIMSPMFSIIFGGSNEISYVFFFRSFQASTGKKLCGKNPGKNPGSQNFDAKHSAMVFDQCVSCPGCPLPPTAKAQWPGNRVWCNQGIWNSKKKIFRNFSFSFRCLVVLRR